MNKIGMNEKCMALIYLLERFAGSVMCDAEEASKALIIEITGLLAEVYPAVMVLYDNPKMAERADEKVYWLNQLSRINEVLAGEDEMAKMDVLYFETRSNLLEIMDVAAEKGIAL